MSVLHRFCVNLLRSAPIWGQFAAFCIDCDDVVSKSLRPASIWGQFAAFWTDLGPIRCVLARGGSWADFRAWAASRAGVRPSTFPALGPRSSFTADAAFLRRTAPSAVKEDVLREEGRGAGLATKEGRGALLPRSEICTLCCVLRRFGASLRRSASQSAFCADLGLASSGDASYQVAPRSKLAQNRCRTQQIGPKSRQGAAI